MHRRLLAVLALVTALLVVAPASGTAAAPAKAKAKASWGWYYGTTKLEVDPATLQALGSLGVSPGVVEPASLDGATYRFPITSSLGRVLRSGVISHRGGISLTAGDVTVELTDFDIDLKQRLLYGEVNGEGPVALLDLDYGRAGLKFRWGKLKLGPVGTTLTAGAADALNSAFGTDALSDDTVIGDAMVRYRLFPF